MLLVLIFFAPASNSFAAHLGALEIPIQSLDPIQASDTNSQFIILNSWDGLVSWTLDGGIEPRIAESWEFLDGGRKVRFKIRKHVKFQDGTPLETRHVAAHLDRLRMSQGYYSGHFNLVKRVHCCPVRSIA